MASDQTPQPYSPGALTFIAQYAQQINQYAALLGVPPAAIAVGIAREITRTDVESVILDDTHAVGVAMALHYADTTDREKRGQNTY